MKRAIITVLIAVMLMFFASGCGKNKDINPNLDTSREIVLTVSYGLDEMKGIDAVAARFSKKYPNCQVVYEKLQNYNEAVITRLSGSSDKIDMFITGGLLNDNSPTAPYALELFSQADKIDLSDTFEGLIQNYTLTDSNNKYIYAIPIGAELRGLYVNKSILKQYDIEMPKTGDELLAACKKLKEAGYIPMQGNPSRFAQQLLYPYVCNIVANAEDYNKTYSRIENCEPGVSELFREPMYFLYELMSNYYYDYKTSQDENILNDTSDWTIARALLNITEDENGEFVLGEGFGKTVFTSGILSMQEYFERYKEDYRSPVEYEFVFAPVSSEGGYAYLSPACGIAINKYGDNVDWACEFFDFLFEKENNMIYAEAAGIAPNTTDTLELTTAKFDIPKDRISQLGDVTFSYTFYNVINDSLIKISKGNNPKYMKTNTDGTTELYDFEYYMQGLESKFAEQRK